MKIPKGVLSEKRYDDMLKYVYATTDQILVNSGIFVEVYGEYHHGKYNPKEDESAFDKISRLFFEVEGHTFETLDEVRKAISNKAFL